MGPREGTAQDYTRRNVAADSVPLFFFPFFISIAYLTTHDRAFAFLLHDVVRHHWCHATYTALLFLHNANVSVFD